jgi:Ser/Thr protein kinase RdoA (MazF antagonist)
LLTDFYSASFSEQVQRLTALAHVALRQWDGDFAPPQPIKFRENAVFAVERTDGGKAVLRLHRSGYHTDAELRSELAWMQALTRAGVEVPQVIPTREGQLFARVSDAQVPEPRQVDMLAWVDGSPIGEIDAQGVSIVGDMADLYRRAGVLAGQLHNHGSTWQRPADFVRHAWDTEGLLGPDPLWGRFWELPGLSRAQRRLVEAARDKARRELEQLSRGRDAFGLIHSDFVPENLLFDGRHLRLIDFDDAGFGWHLFELATPLFFHVGEDCYPLAEESLIAGYRSVRPLSQAHLAALPLLTLVRGFTYLGWVHTRRETAAAQTQTPMVIKRACALCESYMDSH